MEMSKSYWIFESGAWERLGLAVRLWELIVTRALAKII